jgi:thioredoxin 1
VAVGGGADPVGWLLSHQLDEDSCGAARVQKHDPVAHRSGSRCFVDELVALSREAGQGGLQVGYTVGNVVQAGTATLQEPAYGGIRAGRLQQLEPASATADEDNIDLLGGDVLHRGTGGAGDGFKERLHAGDGLHSDRHVVEGQFQWHAPASFLQNRDRSEANTSPRVRTRQRERRHKEMVMAENGGPISVTDANFGDEIEQGQGLAIVDFWASWCGPCRMVAPVIEQLASEHAGKLKVAKVDVDANQQVSMKYNIRSIPSILFFKDGKHIDTVVGAVPKALLERKIAEHS